MGAVIGVIDIVETTFHLWDLSCLTQRHVNDELVIGDVSFIVDDLLVTHTDILKVHIWIIVRNWFCASADLVYF